jgi:hypothetical protein
MTPTRETRAVVMLPKELIQHNTDQCQGEACPGNKIGVSHATSPPRSSVLSVRADLQGLTMRAAP